MKVKSSITLFYYNIYDFYLKNISNIKNFEANEIVENLYLGSIEGFYYI
jgi:hypothetical protein